MSAGSLLLVILGIGVAGVLGGLGEALFGRAAPDASLLGWSWRDPRVRGVTVFLAGSVIAIGALGMFLSIA